MNDPNGLIYHAGYYHLFFQYNPFGNRWGHMSWGHARSKDLLNWEELPIAIPEQPDHMIFSGSAVFDAKNNRLAAFYTAHKEGNQSQHLAFSYDDGVTWQLYEKNPVLDLNLAEFRDPKVFKYQEHWIMVVVKAKEEKICFFASKDLIIWEFLSDYSIPNLNHLYECPDLFQVDGKWALFLSTSPGGAAGGTGVHYVIGEFDGVNFGAESNCEYLDYGPDYYATVTFNESPERISIGWMNNWLYANDIERSPWHGSMTSARKLSIVDGRLQQEFLAPAESFKIPETVNEFQFDYPEGAIKFRRVIKDGTSQIEVDRGELWPWQLKTFSIPAAGPLEIKAIFDAGSIELEINGRFATALIEVGPDIPALRLP